MHPDKLVRLAAVAKRLSSFEELDDVVEVIVQTTAELTGGEGSSLLLFDEEDAVLRYVALSWCGPESEIRSNVEEIAVPLDGNVAGWVLRKKRPINVHRTGADPLIDPRVEAQMHTPVRCVAATPLIYRGVPIGVLEAFNHSSGKFGADALEAMETLSSLAAVSIYNGHLLHRSRQAYENLADLDQMKTDFIAIASHELRTPLGVIIGHASVLQEISDRDMREQLAVIERNARQLQEIVENMTAINQIEVRKSDAVTPPVQLNSFLRNAAQAFLEEAKLRRTILQIDLPGDELHARIAPDKLAIVTHNLIRNALAFTPENGEGKILVSLRREAGRCVVAVTDNGIGIPPDEIERVFEMFYQVEDHMRRRHGGMGVGLTTAKFLIEQAGGKIWVESIEGQGSRFAFSLPLSPAPEKQRALSSW